MLSRAEQPYTKGSAKRDKMCVRLDFLEGRGELLPLKVRCELWGWHLSSYAIWIEPFNSCTWPEPALHFSEPGFSLFTAINFFFSVGFFSPLKRYLESPPSCYIPKLCIPSIPAAGSAQAPCSPPVQQHPGALGGAGTAQLPQTHLIPMGFGVLGCRVGCRRSFLLIGEEDTGICQGSAQFGKVPSL